MEPRIFFTEDPWKISVEDFVRKHSQEDIFIHPTSTIEEGVVLKGPVYIGPNCFVGAHAYLRGGVYLMGNNSVGPGCELKSCILFPKTNLAHFNFIGDSIVGSNVNFEAGSIVANHFNERADKEIFPGVTKFGALIGDNCKIGANAVLSPGTILAKNTIVARQELVNQQSMEKKPKFNWRDLFINKAFDLVMVVLGVTIAFELESWQSNAAKESLDHFYKERLYADVNADIDEIDGILTELHKDETSVANYLQNMNKLPADSLMSPLLATLSFETFSASDNTYNTLIASAGLNTFNDRELMERLTEYYGSYESLRRFEMVYTNVVFEIHKNFTPYVIYDQRKIVNKNVTSLPEARNAFLLALNQLNTGIEDYTDALNRAKALKTALENSL